MNRELEVIGGFLERHPDQVLIVIVEDYISPATIEQAFEQTGLMRYVATLDRRAPLPTMGELIARGQRLVVFAEEKGGSPAWYMPAFSFIQDTPLGATRPDQLSCKRYRGEADSPLLLLNYWIPPFPPSPTLNAGIGRRAFLRGARALPGEAWVQGRDRRSRLLPAHVRCAGREGTQRAKVSCPLSLLPPNVRRAVSRVAHGCSPGSPQSVAGRRAGSRPARLTATGRPAPDRPDPVAVLAAQAASRVQELVPIRYGRMLVSPFTFYRGAAAVMAGDLAGTPDSGIVVQACGDAHISNFGGFAAPDRRLIFGPNDFDETLPGPWEWDVKRMAASAEIAGRDVGLPADRRRWIVTDCVREYREAMRGFARESHLDVWYERLNASELVDRFGGKLGGKGRIVFAKPFAKARRKTSLRAVKKLTERVDGELRFRSVPPLLVPLRELFDPADARDEADYIRELLTSTREPRRGPALPVRHLPVRRHGPQGRRRRERRHARLGVPARRPRRQGPARAAGKGGAGLGARAPPGRERVRRTTASASSAASGSRRRPATSSSAGSAAQGSTARSTTSTSASCGTGRRRPISRR